MLAIVGAGFAGLACAVEALKAGYQVDIFDEKGIGGGASGVASGLLHPYPGMHARRSKRADEALDAVFELFDLCEETVYREGIIRIPVRTDQAELFAERADQYDDLAWDGEILHIRSGVTVYSQKYLQNLWKFCESRGCVLHKKRVETLPTGYKHVILAAGAGMLNLMPELQLRPTRGQILQCHLSQAYDESIIGDGYLALTEKVGHYHLGATYEHDNLTDIPDLERAEALIMPKASRYLNSKIHIDGVRAGVRVSPKGDYYPLAQKINDQVSVLTGLGSRGLLYHALMAKDLLGLISKM